jgi:hypothetical protein
MQTDNSEWFKENERYFTLKVIEEEIGCPKTTLQKWIKGERVLAERWRIALNDFVFRLTGMNKFTEAPVIGEVRERFLKDSNPLVEVRKELVYHKDAEEISKKEKVKILERVIEKVTNVPKEDPLVKEPIKMGFDMMTKTKPIVLWKFNGLDNMKRIEGNIFSDGNRFAVQKLFGTINKYAIVDSLNEAKDIVLSLKK